MRYALLIGNDRYDDASWSPLKSPVADVRAMAEVLRDKSIGGFDEVIPLTNCTSGEARSQIGSFVKEKKFDDLVLIYFSGHGDLDRSGLILALRDTRRDNLFATGLDASSISKQMDDCRSKRQVLILDCCYGGSFDTGKGPREKKLIPSDLGGEGFGRIILTASDRAEVAHEGWQAQIGTRLSLFTHFLTEGLRTGDAAGRGQEEISVDEWYEYASREVAAASSKQSPQTPIKMGRQAGDLIIAHNPKAKPIGPRMPSEVELERALDCDSPNMWKAAVKDLGLLLRSSDAAQAKWARARLERLKDDDRKAVSSRASRLLAEANAPARVEERPVQLGTNVPFFQKEEHSGNRESYLLRSWSAAARSGAVRRELESQAKPAVQAGARAKESTNDHTDRLFAGIILGLLVAAAVDFVMIRILGFPKTELTSGTFDNVYQAFPWFEGFVGYCTLIAVGLFAGLGKYYPGKNWGTIFWTTSVVAFFTAVLAASI